MTWKQNRLGIISITASKGSATSVVILMNTSGDDLICVLFSITPILRANYSFSNREATIEMGYSVGLLTGHAKKVIALFISRSRNVLLRHSSRGVPYC